MMKKILPCFLLLFVICNASAQFPGHSLKEKTLPKKSSTTATIKNGNSKVSSKQSSAAISINGQWRGFFDNDGDIILTGDGNTEYVLELEINGSAISGYSYSYFENRRYYVICSVNGTYNKRSRSMVVNEVTRVKGSTAPGQSDCLQTHVLTYGKQGGIETLSGTWRTSPYQEGDGCGVGNTTLTRRTLSKDLAAYNKSQNRTPFSSTKPKTTLPSFPDKNKASSAPVAKAITKPKVTTPATAPQKNNPSKEDDKNVTTDVKKQPESNPDQDISFEKRNSDVIKTIEINNEYFKVDLYDNGDIDGDSISLFYNGKLLLSHKRLSDKPISLTLDVTTDKQINELTMYAENLGEIPPNTALMVVTDGNNRYEVRIASDLKKSGTIRFIHKEKEKAKAP